MSYRSSLASALGGGRASPYAPGRLGENDRSFSELFEYVEPSEVSSNGHYDRPSGILVEDDDAPDLVHVKYMGTAFSLSFPPYSISESGVYVKDLRRRVADKLGADVRKVRLVYKDKELRFDPYPIKTYGCKQNSEIAVVVTEHVNDFGRAENQPSSDNNSGSESPPRPSNERRRPRGNSSVRHRNDSFETRPESGGYLHPNGHGHAQRESRENRRRSTSPARARSKSPAPSRSTATPSPRPPPADPNTPLGKVQNLQNLFYDRWRPQGQNYLASPPKDATTKDKEYRRISESVMKHIIEAADAIELQGDAEARAARKKVLQEAQELLQKLDVAKSQ